MYTETEGDAHYLPTILDPPRPSVHLIAEQQTRLTEPTKRQKGPLVTSHTNAVYRSIKLQRALMKCLWSRDGDDPQAFDNHGRRLKFGARRLYLPRNKNLTWRTRIKDERREMPWH